MSPDQLPDDLDALKRIIAAMAQDAVAAQAEIAKLRFQLARYRRAEFGRSSEKLATGFDRAEQLELAIEALEADQAERLAAASPVVAAAIEAATEAQKPARRPLPEHLPREEVRHRVPGACPSCGGALRRIGEDVTETLDYVPGRFKVAYSGDVGRAFRLMSATCSERSRPAVPIEVGLDNQRIAAAHKLQRLALRWPIRDRA
jgi:transposase